jgi:flavodoxin I
MKKMGIIYGSSTGTCESIAQTIAEKLGVASVDVIDASKITTEKVESYDILLLGTSTWGDGELQDDWYDAIKMIKTADLNGKIVALFGCTCLQCGVWKGDEKPDVCQDAKWQQKHLS